MGTKKKISRGMLVRNLIRRSVTSTRIQVSGNEPLNTRSSVASGERHEACISDQIRNLYLAICPSNDQIQEKDLFLSRLQQSIDGVLEAAVVAPFGSAVNGFWTPNSDIDVCLQVPGCRTRASQIDALRKVASCLHSISSHYIEPRFTARVPIIHWAPRKSGYLACDISINNNLAVVNSRLIGAYSAIDPRMVELGMIIKHWANARGINDRSRGTLSSFSLLLMLIHFLQRRTPPILPSLQDMALQVNQSPSYCQGSDIRYVTDPSLIQMELSRLSANSESQNTENSGTLLLEFFRYYGFTYRQGVIGIRDLRPFHSVDVTSEANVYLVVDNPFEVGKDVANVSANQHSRIRQEFRRAHSLLESGASLTELCSGVASSPTTHRQAGSHPTDPPMHSLGPSRPNRNTRNTRHR